MPPPPFSWNAFLVGFAIALWIAIVVLFVLPNEDEPAPIVHCTTGGCGASGGPTFPGPLWIPSGTDNYYCTNTQDGGGYVEDAGGGYVEDAGGGYVEDGGGYVEDGGGYVEDSAPRSPAPSGDHESVDRQALEYHCETNDAGGGYVEDNGSRDVSVPMRSSGPFHCWKDGNDNAVVLRSEPAGASIAYYRTQLNSNQDLVLLDGANPVEADLVTIPAAAGMLPPYVYCMVAKANGNTVIVDKAGTCIAGTCTPP